MDGRIFGIKPLSLSVLTLLLVLLVSCSPASPEQVATAIDPTADVTVAPIQETLVLPTDNPVTSTDLPSLVSVATSRGPDLEATDPTTVSLASGQLQLVEFFRFTWSTCRSMAPMVHGLEAEYFGKVQFTYLDADDQATKDFQRSLGFAYQPEFYLLDGEGNVLQKWIGYVSESDFREVFDQYQ